MLLVEPTSSTIWGCVAFRKMTLLDAECRTRMLVCMICMHVDRHTHEEFMRALNLEPSESRTFQLHHGSETFNLPSR